MELLEGVSSIQCAARWGDCGHREAISENVVGNSPTVTATAHCLKHECNGQDHRVRREENGMNDGVGPIAAYTTHWTTNGRDAVAEIDGVAIIMADDGEMRMDVEWRERAKVAHFRFVYLWLSFGALCTR